MSSDSGYTTVEVAVLVGCGLFVVLGPMAMARLQRDRFRTYEVTVFGVLFAIIGMLIMGLVIVDRSDRLDEERITAAIQSQYRIIRPLLDRNQQTVAWDDGAHGSCSARFSMHGDRVDILAGTVFCDPPPRKSDTVLTKDQLAAEVASIQAFMQSLDNTP